MLVTVFEDRPDGFAGVQLAVASLVRHLPGVRISVIRPGLTGGEHRWLAERPGVRVTDRSFAARGWDVKPTVLLAALERADDVVWWDADLLAVGDLRRVLPDRAPDALVATEETYWGQEQGTGQRGRAWGLAPGRRLPTTVNTALLRVGQRHRPLLTAWQHLLGDQRYRSAQATAADRRPLHLLGDQEVLTALLESRPFAAEPLLLLRRGVGIAQCFGPAGFTVGERVRAASRREVPPIVHAMGAKPWYLLPWPHGGRPPRTAHPAAWRNFYERLHAQLSPYTVAAAAYRGDLSSPAWLDSRSAWASAVRLGSGGSPVLDELPLALLDSVVRRVRRRLGVGRFGL